MSPLTQADFAALEARAQASDRAIRNDPDVPLGLVGLIGLVAELAAGLRQMTNEIELLRHQVGRVGGEIEATMQAHLENSPHIHADGSSI